MTENSGVWYFDVSDIEIIHKKVQEFFCEEEPIPPFDSVNIKELKFVLHTVREKIFNKELYPELEDKTAMLFFLINKKHLFPNGNKRMSFVCTASFLFVNNRQFVVSDEDLANKAIEVALHSHDDDFDWLKINLAKWIKDNTESL